MPTNKICHIRKTGLLDNFTFNSSFFKQFEGQDGDRKYDHSDSESITEDEYLSAIRPW